VLPIDKNAVWPAIKTIIPLVISATALLIVLWDRKPRLNIKARSKLWYHLRPNSSRTHVNFMGSIEIYNVSGRANAVRAYHIWCQRAGFGWEKMAVDRYTISPAVGDPSQDKDI
jgi:hypothetical protein